MSDSCLPMKRNNYTPVDDDNLVIVTDDECLECLCPRHETNRDLYIGGLPNSIPVDLISEENKYVFPSIINFLDTMQTYYDNSNEINLTTIQGRDNKYAWEEGGTFTDKDSLLAAYDTLTINKAHRVDNNVDPAKYYRITMNTDLVVTDFNELKVTPTLPATTIFLNLDDEHLYKIRKNVKKVYETFAELENDIVNHEIGELYAVTGNNYVCMYNGGNSFPDSHDYICNYFYSIADEDDILKEIPRVYHFNIYISPGQYNGNIENFTSNHYTFYSNDKASTIIDGNIAWSSYFHDITFKSTTAKYFHGYFCDCRFEINAEHTAMWSLSNSTEIHHYMSISTLFNCDGYIYSGNATTFTDINGYIHSSSADITLLAYYSSFDVKTGKGADGEWNNTVQHSCGYGGRISITGHFKELTAIAGDGGSIATYSEGYQYHPPYGGLGGSVNITISDDNNYPYPDDYKECLLNLQSGNAGDGADGNSEYMSGTKGGNGGNVDLIINKDISITDEERSKFIINIICGNGGDGGDGVDFIAGSYQGGNGGAGGSGGNFTCRGAANATYNITTGDGGEAGVSGNYGISGAKGGSAGNVLFTKYNQYFKGSLDGIYNITFGDAQDGADATNGYRDANKRYVTGGDGGDGGASGNISTTTIEPIEGNAIFNIIYGDLGSGGDGGDECCWQFDYPGGRGYGGNGGDGSDFTPFTVGSNGNITVNITLPVVVGDGGNGGYGIDGIGNSRGCHGGYGGDSYGDGSVAGNGGDGGDGLNGLATHPDDMWQYERNPVIAGNGGNGGIAHGTNSKGGDGGRGGKGGHDDWYTELDSSGAMGGSGGRGGDAYGDGTIGGNGGRGGNGGDGETPVDGIPGYNPGEGVPDWWRPECGGRAGNGGGGGHAYGENTLGGNGGDNGNYGSPASGVGCSDDDDCDRGDIGYFNGDDTHNYVGCNGASGPAGNGGNGKTPGVGGSGTCDSAPHCYHIEYKVCNETHGYMVDYCTNCVTHCDGDGNNGNVV